MLAEVVELYESGGGGAGIRWLSKPRPTLPAYGDKALIQQAVANLLDNAVKFSPSGATVRLDASAGRAAVIAVCDQGPGIPESERGKATARFYRGETARSTPGSGLGLSLVAAVAQLHGGELRLEDNAPGLRAVLVLPIPEEANSPRAGADWCWQALRLIAGRDNGDMPDGTVGMASFRSAKALLRREPRHESLAASCLRGEKMGPTQPTGGIRT